MLKIYNTLTRQVEEFRPINPPNVGMYTCGPTVYDHMHIGNLRTFIMSDILRRILEINGYRVKAVQNITDIDDKIIARAKEKGVTIQQLADEYTGYFLKDINKLNIRPSTASPKATEHIGAMIKYIEGLIKKGLAYVEKDGSVYFDISKFGDYGKLSKLDKRQLKSGTRVLSDEYPKDSVQDFALWKSVKPDEVGWDSPWGKGRPGWHIECSVMSQEYLGETFDLHVGGVDLMFPHHENEIAQSEGKTGRPFVNYFIHGEHLLVDGKKMSKSLNNFYTLDNLEEKSFGPLAFRYLVLTSHYRDPLNFTWQSLEAAQNALNSLREQIREWPAQDSLPEQSKDDVGQFWQKFKEAANLDLNIPQTLAVMWDLVRSDLPNSKKADQLLKMDQILGLGLLEFLGRKLKIPKDVQRLVDQREIVRKSGDFKQSDEIRQEIKKLGFILEDTPEGPKIKKL